MKVRLIFEYEIKESDGVGTQYDALHVAVAELTQLLEEADSMDDVADVFSEIKYVPSVVELRQDGGPEKGFEYSLR